MLHRVGGELVLDALVRLGVVAVVKEFVKQGLDQVLAGHLGEAGGALKETGLKGGRVGLGGERVLLKDGFIQCN